MHGWVGYEVENINTGKRHRITGYETQMGIFILDGGWGREGTNWMAELFWKNHKVVTLKDGDQQGSQGDHE